MVTTTLNTPIIQRHIQNPGKHLRWNRTQSKIWDEAFCEKKLFSQEAPSKMFHRVLSTPRLLDTSLLHTDTTEPQNVHVHSFARLSFVRKEKASYFINCVVFFVPILRISILCSNSPM